MSDYLDTLKFIIELGDNSSSAVYLYIGYKVLSDILGFILLAMAGIGIAKLIRYYIDKEYSN